MLEGIRVLDLSRLLPGPYASMILGDLGAEIIKIEEPGKGDYMRQFEPLVNNDSAFFLAVNRNKKSITLNLKTHQGREIFCKLLRTSDVLLEGFRPGVMESLHLGCDVLREINPNFIYCSISGYGQDGPFRDKAGHDINYISVSGILGTTGTRNGVPVIPGIQIADLTGGMYAVIGILAALLRRHKQGQGAKFDVSMADCLFSLISMHAANYLATNTPPERGNMMLSGNLVCYNIYETKDGGYVALGALEAKFWRNFCRGLDRNDLIPAHMDTVKDEETYSKVQEIFLSRTRDQWANFAREVDCCLSPVENLNEVITGEYAQERKMLLELQHSTEGKLTQVRSPLNWQNPCLEAHLPPPMLGEHTNEILLSLGLTNNEIEELKQQKVI